MKAKSEVWTTVKDHTWTEIMSGAGGDVWDEVCGRVGDKTRVGPLAKISLTWDSVAGQYLEEFGTGWDLK